MTFGSTLLQNPIKTALHKDESSFRFIVKGQGVILFNNKYPELCGVSIYNNYKTDGLTIQITPMNVIVMRIKNHAILNDPNNKSGLLNMKGVYYWISLDSQNQRLFVGIGEARIENVIYQYQWIWKKEQDDMRRANKLFLESLYHIEVIETVSPIELLRDPITTSIPMYVLDTDRLSIDDVASGVYLPDSNLDSICQKLFNCISGKNFVLDDPSFPDFSKAIENSIKTPGLWCYERLRQKATEFNKDILETYLRITIGKNNGESPGIPYVIEIWPVGHFSPIHNHAGANAIIRVLHGSINVSLFSFLCDKNGGLKPFNRVDFNKDDITWISPTLNQVHQLKNLETNKDTCITIQCYMNDSDYFDFIDAAGDVQKYEPDSDMDFIAFKMRMKQEWETQKKSSLKYEDMLLPSLKELCRKNKIKGFSTMKRLEIVELLNNMYNNNTGNMYNNNTGNNNNNNTGNM
jgi:hypothetical protein